MAGVRARAAHVCGCIALGPDWPPSNFGSNVASTAVEVDNVAYAVPDIIPRSLLSNILCLNPWKDLFFGGMPTLQSIAGVDKPFANGGPAAAPTAALQQRNPASDLAEPGSVPAGATGADEQYVMRCAPFPTTCGLYLLCHHRQGQGGDWQGLP